MSPGQEEALNRTARDALADLGKAWQGLVDKATELRIARVAPQDGSIDSAPWLTGPFAGDCGLDLAIREDATIRMGESVNIPCGVAVQLPPGSFGWIVGRSSTWSRHGLVVMPGIIDEGWRGELRTLVYKPYAFSRTASASQHETVNLKKGTRLAQLVVLPNLMQTLTVTEVRLADLSESDRGTNGFGSSGE